MKYTSLNEVLVATEVSQTTNSSHKTNTVHLYTVDTVLGRVIDIRILTIKTVRRYFMQTSGN